MKIINHKAHKERHKAHKVYKYTLCTLCVNFAPFVFKKSINKMNSIK